MVLRESGRCYGYLGCMTGAEGCYGGLGWCDGDLGVLLGTPGPNEDIRPSLKEDLNGRSERTRRRETEGTLYGSRQTRVQLEREKIRGPTRV